MYVMVNLNEGLKRHTLLRETIQGINTYFEKRVLAKHRTKNKDPVEVLNKKLC